MSDTAYDYQALAIDALTAFQKHDPAAFARIMDIARKCPGDSCLKDAAEEIVTMLIHAVSVGHDLPAAIVDAMAEVHRGLLARAGQQ